jgi:hypothetical protein
MIGSAVWRQQSGQAERARSKAISPPALTPQPAHTPRLSTPELSPYHDWQSYLVAHQATAPRAALVKLPPPRARLISLPEWKPGETRSVMMLYNLEVLATYRGQLQSQDMLPSSGNQLGDMWVVGNVPWLWLLAPGA